MLAAPQSRASLPETVTVQLFEAHGPISQLDLTGPMEIIKPISKVVPSGHYRVQVKNRQLELSTLAPGQTPLFYAPRIVIRARQAGELHISIPSVARNYQGEIQLSCNPDRTIRVCNKIGIQDYVTAVVGSETLPEWPDEMLKAQAILTQTGLQRYKPQDKLGDSTQKEAYLGADYARPQVRTAVLNVWGKTLTFKGQPITPFYHAACSGGTSDGAQYFGKPAGTLPYLTSVHCNYCRQSPFWQIKRSVIPLKVFQRACAHGVPEVVSLDSQKRPLSIRFSNGTIMSGYQFWLRLGQQLGWDKVPGTRYKLDNNLSGVEIDSSGAGHGIGLCQWGAAQLARLGKNHEQILRYYFPGTQIK